MWESSFVLVNGSRMHITRTGGSKPPLVLAHGVTDDGLCWTPLAQRLEADYDLIMVDGRGHGRSDPIPQKYGPREQAGDLGGVISGLGLTRPFILGHSMGAVTALVLAGIYPDLPGAILLEDPPDWWMPPVPEAPADSERQATYTLWFKELKTKSVEQLISEQRVSSPGWSEGELRPWAEAKLRFDPQALGIFGPNPAASVDWKEVLPRIICPALLITADPARGSIVTPGSAQALKMKVTQLQIVHIPGAGHNIRREQFNLYLETVSAFLHGVKAVT